MVEEILIKPGVFYYPEYFNRSIQEELRDEILSYSNELGWFQPTLPRWGTPFSVKMLNYGPLGWVSDKSGYRYQPTHPENGVMWRPFPIIISSLWSSLNAGFDNPEACLINYYHAQARMGLHQDRDEQDLTVPVISVSLGDTALFRIGTSDRKGPTQSLKLKSGDVLVFGGPARLDFHGIDRIYPGTSTLLPEGGRINMTLRRVTKSEA